jgi:hypothetical protein
VWTERGKSSSLSAAAATSKLIHTFRYIVHLTANSSLLTANIFPVSTNIFPAHDQHLPSQDQIFHPTTYTMKLAVAALLLAPLSCEALHSTIQGIVGKNCSQKKLASCINDDGTFGCAMVQKIPLCVNENKDFQCRLACNELIFGAKPHYMYSTKIP